MSSNSEFLGGKPVRIPKALRDELANAIQAHLAAVEKLTAVLDKADGDADLEDNADDEPSLGEHHARSSNGLYALLLDAEGDEHDGREPSLGAQDPAWENTDQTAWSQGSNDDREGDEHDGREPDVDDEHSLGWPAGMSQVQTLKNCQGTIYLPGSGKTDWIDLAGGLEGEHDGREPQGDDEPGGDEDADDSDLEPCCPPVLT